MKKIILVTHGKSQKDLPSPSLTKEGKKQMEQLRDQLLKEFDGFDYVISGIGKRHREACEIITGRRADLETEIVGMPETLSSDGKYMIFPDGEKVPFKKYERTRFKDILKQIPPFLKQLFDRPEKKILIIGGKVTGIGAEIHPKKVESARIYYLELTPSGKVMIRE